MIELLAACLLDDEKSFIEFTVNKVIVEKKRLSRCLMRGSLLTQARDFFSSF